MTATERIPPKGLILDLISPFDAGGGLDRPGLERHLATLLPYVDGLFLGSPTLGQGMTLDKEARWTLVHAVLEALKGRRDPVPLGVWVTRRTEDETRETLLFLAERIAKAASKQGVFWVDTPLHYHSNRGLPDVYGKLCALTDIPFVLHNDPHLIAGLQIPLKRSNIRTAVLKELSFMDKIVGVIASGPLYRMANYQRAVRARSGFRVYDGNEGAYLDHPTKQGLVCMGANLAPAAWKKGVEATTAGTTDLSPYPDALRQMLETGAYLRDLRAIYERSPLHIIRACLEDRGILDRSAYTWGPDVMEAVKSLRDLSSQSPL